MTPIGWGLAQGGSCHAAGRHEGGMQEAVLFPGMPRQDTLPLSLILVSGGCTVDGQQLQQPHQLHPW